MNFSSYVINLHGIYIFEFFKFTTLKSPPGTSDFVVIGFNFLKSSIDNIIVTIIEINKKEIAMHPPNIVTLILFS